MTQLYFVRLTPNQHKAGEPKGSFNIGAIGGTSQRGLLQVSPLAAADAGLGNGRGKGLTDTQIANVNPDYIANIYIPAVNIRVGSNYLGIRIRQAGGLAGGLMGYRGIGAEGRRYADRIIHCAAKVKSGDVQGGLDDIYP